MSHFPQATFQEIDLASAVTIPSTTANQVPSGNPVTTAHGKSGFKGSLCVEVSGGCTITPWAYSPISQQWRKVAAAAASQSKTFTSGGMDWFLVPNDAYIFIESDTSTIEVWTDLLPLPAQY